MAIAPRVGDRSPSPREPALAHELFVIDEDSGLSSLPVPFFMPAAEAWASDAGDWFVAAAEALDWRAAGCSALRSGESVACHIRQLHVGGSLAFGLTGRSRVPDAGEDGCLPPPPARISDTLARDGSQSSSQ